MLVIGALLRYYEQPRARTVYKPNADWRSVAAYLRSDPPAPGRHGILLTTSPAEELLYYGGGAFQIRSGPPAGGGLPDRTAGPTSAAWRPGSWQVVPAGSLPASELCAVAQAPDAERRFVVKNEYWPQDVDLLIERLGRECGAELAVAREFKGITLLRLDAPSRSGMAPVAPSATHPSRRQLAPARDVSAGSPPLRAGTGG
jgi:hypothetical protein